MTDGRTYNYALSLKEQFATLPPEEQQAQLDALTEEQAQALLYDWGFNARPKQLEGFIDTDWNYWLILAGRGFGKTRTGAEWVRAQVKAGCRRIGIIAPTSADARDVIVEGESGILACCDPDDMPLFEPTKRRLTWPNGAIATLYSAEEPDRLRGPQHDAIWMDEIAAWANGNAETIQRTWDMAMFGLRLGKRPQVCVTTTPKPIPLVQMFIKWSKDPSKGMKITTGSTYENKSNLAKSFFNQVAQYEGTALGRQELHAEVLDLEDSGIIKRSWFRKWPAGKKLPYFIYIVQSYDTAYTEKTHNDPTACTTWGVFQRDDGVFCVMLLDAWTDYLQYPDLRKKVKEEFAARYGGTGEISDPGQLPDIALIEEKGSGITLIQDLNRMGVPIRPYNPGKMDKVQRLHAVSHIPMNGRVYVPESTKVPGEFVTWATDFITEVCIFPNSLHDDYTDTFSQVLALLRDQNFIVIDPEEKEDEYADEDPKRNSRVENPYAA
jgi:predicted phage terminase large subunit-like protein